MLPLPSGQRERIGNRVRIPDGTAAVCAEAACRAKAGHWGNLRRRARPSRRESEDLLVGNRIFGFVMQEDGCYNAHVL